MVLLHDVDEAVLGDVVCEELHNLDALGLEAGHDQVAHEQALLGDAVGGEAEVADLGVHGLDALPRGGGVVVGLEQAARASGGPQLEVGQVDVDQPVQQVERLERIVGRRVVDDGQGQAIVPGMQDAQSNLGHDTGSGFSQRRQTETRHGRRPMDRLVLV